MGKSVTCFENPSTTTTYLQLPPLRFLSIVLMSKNIFSNGKLLVIGCRGVFVFCIFCLWHTLQLRTQLLTKPWSPKDHHFVNTVARVLVHPLCPNKSWDSNRMFGSIIGGTIIKFLVACTRLYKSLCRSVGRSVCLLVGRSIRHTPCFFIDYI